MSVTARSPGIGVAVGVAVSVGVNVGGGEILTSTWAWLFVSSNSATWPNGSTVTVFVTMPSSGTNPTIVIVSTAPGSIAPSWQSSSPPVSEPMIAQLPAVELTSV